METKKYGVTGMICAACSAHVEKATRGVYWREQIHHLYLDFKV